MDGNGTVKKKKKKEDIFEPISTRLRTFAGPSNRWVIPAISARHRLARRDTYWRVWRPANHFEYLFVKFHDKKNSLIKIMPLDERTMGFIVIHTSFKKQIQRQNKKKKKEEGKKSRKKEKSVTLRERKKILASRDGANLPRPAAVRLFPFSFSFQPSLRVSFPPSPIYLPIRPSARLCLSFGPARLPAPLFRPDKSISLDFHFYASIARVCNRAAQRMTTKGYRCTSNYDRCVPFSF